MTRFPMMLMLLGASLVILSTLFETTEALSCPCFALNDFECGPFDPSSCPGGVTRDACGCCDTCKKLEGERCHGPWRIAGICANGLRCEYEGRPIDPTSQEIGTCVRIWRYRTGGYRS